MGLCVLCALAAALPLTALAQATAPASGTVLFERNQSAAPVDKKEPSIAKPAVPVTDAERNSLTFTAYDLDVHLAPEKAQLVVHARFTVRNSGTKPLPRLVLQLSSSLHWESFALQKSPLTFSEDVIDTDADHTGKVQEAVVPLAQPLAPGAALELEAFY